MKFKYVKEFEFPADRGFRGSNKMPAKVGKVSGAPHMESKPKVGKGQGFAEGGRVPGYDMDRLPAKNPPGRGMDLAPSKPFKGEYQGYEKGGSVKKLARGGSPLTRAQQNMPIRNVGRYVPSDYVVNPNRMPTLEEQLAKAEIRKSEAATRAVQKKLAEDAAKSAALKTVGKVAARAIPGLGAALTAYDVGKYAYDKYKQSQARKKPTVTVEEMPDSGAPPAPSRGGGGGMGIISGGAMARGMPTSGLPAKRGSITVEETEDVGYKRGGSVKGKAKIGKVMGEYKAGKLHSGSKKGPVVKSEKQAMAIALSEARKAGAKIPKKAMGGMFNDENMAYESKGPKTRYTAAKGRRMARERAMERRALDKARHAEKYAPGMSLDMPDRKKHGGMPVHRRKPMYGGGKC